MTTHSVSSGYLRILTWTLLTTAAFPVIQSAASPWTLGRGDVYGFVGFFRSRTHHFFDSDSNRRTFLNDGTSRVRGFSLAGSFGVTNRLMVSGSLPIVWFKLQDNFVTEQGRSLGDTRLSLRYRTFDGPIMAAVEGGVKFPTATARDPARVQIGEGQYDYELLGSVGRYWFFEGIRASVDAGYRWRRRNGDTGFKPGNERILRLEMSYTPNSRLSLSTLVDGFSGSDGNAKVFSLTASTLTARHAASLIPTVSYRISGPWQVAVSASLPLAGRRTYAGRQFALGFSYNGAALDKQLSIGGFSNPRGGSCCSIQ